MMQASNSGFIIVLATVAITLVAVAVSVLMGNNHLQNVRAQTPQASSAVATP